MIGVRVRAKGLASVTSLWKCAVAAAYLSFVQNSWKRVLSEWKGDQEGSQNIS